MPRKGIKVDILFAGNTMAVSDDFYRHIDKEYRLVILREDVVKQKHKEKNLLYFGCTGDEDTEKIFHTFDFETVVFFSQVLDGEKKIFDELEKLEYILYLCRKGKVKSFIYITGNRQPGEEENGEASRVILLNACEQLCKKSAVNDGINVQLIRMPYLYHCVIKSSHVGRWLDAAMSGQRVKLPGYQNTMTDFVREDDLAGLLERMFDDPWEEPYIETRISGKNKLTFEQLAAILGGLTADKSRKTQIEYTGKDECTPTYQEDSWARNEYGWIPKADIEADLKEAAGRYIKESAGKKRGIFYRLYSNRLLRVTTEQLVLFFVAEALNYITRNNVMFNFLDFRLVYIAIMACMNGLGAGAAAALISSAGYIASNVTAVSWQVLFFNIENWFPFACYMLLGCVLGYTTDKAQDEINSKTKELKLFEEKYAFLHGLYMEVSEGKERFNNQIIGYRDSFGKMYSVVKRLNTTLPEKVFYEAIDVMEEVLDNSHVAVYSISPDSIYSRLYVCSKSCTGKVKKSLKLTDYPELFKSLQNNDIFINKRAKKEYPAYAAPIRRDGMLVGMILIMEADYGRMNIEFSNKLRIMTDMIQDSLVRAMEYKEIDDGAMDNTRILEPDSFEEILDVKKQMRKKQYLDYVILKINPGGKNLSEQNERLSGLVRENDVLGVRDDGNLYLLLSQTGAKDVKAVADRLKKNNIMFEEVRE